MRPFLTLSLQSTLNSLQRPDCFTSYIYIHLQFQSYRNKALATTVHNTIYERFRVVERNDVVPLFPLK